MSALLEQLNYIEACANDALAHNNFYVVGQLEAYLRDMQAAIVDVVTSDEPECDARVLTSKFGDVYAMLERCRYSCRHEPRDVFSCTTEPVVSLQSARNLSDNVSALRSVISEMHSAIQDTQNATDVSFQEIQDRREIRDISAMAVNSVKATLYVQNGNLKAENMRLREQVSELLVENQEVKKVNTELRKRLLEQDNIAVSGKNAHEQLQSERYRAYEDIDRLQSEVLRYQGKFANLSELYRIETAASEQQKQENLARISYLEVENDALIQANRKITQRNAELEQCDMDGASIEIARAAQTIKQLNMQIEELKSKLIAQKAQEIDKTQALKATIAAIHEGDYEYVENVVTEKEDLMTQLNQSRSEIEALKSKLGARRTQI